MNLRVELASVERVSNAPSRAFSSSRRDRSAVRGVPEAVFGREASPGEDSGADIAYHSCCSPFFIEISNIVALSYFR